MSAALEDGTTEIYSLRDQQGRPVVTIEIEHDAFSLNEYGISVVYQASPRTSGAKRTALIERRDMVLAVSAAFARVKGVLLKIAKKHRYRR